MKVAAHLTERVKQEWPLAYWMELVRKLSARGDDLYAFSDDAGVNIDSRNPRLHNFIRRSDAEAVAAFESCDAFVGAPGSRFYAWAIQAGLRIVGLKGATLKGPGVASPISCAGCDDKMGEPHTDCFFGDELCMSEITANDVIKALAA